MDYAHTYPNATILYHASDMCLHIDSDAAYLVQPQARSRVAVHFSLGDKIPDYNSIPNPTHNGPILTECRTVRKVMSLAAAQKRYHYLIKRVPNESNPSLALSNITLRVLIPL